LSGRDGIGDAALVVEAFVGVVEEPEDGGAAQDDRIDGEKGIPAVAVEEALVDGWGDGIAGSPTLIPRVVAEETSASSSMIFHEFCIKLLFFMESYSFSC